MEQITEYFEFFHNEIKDHKIVLGEEITFRQINDLEGYIKGVLFFYAGYSLYIAEYTIIEKNNYKKIKYRYQLLDPDKIPIARWDNAKHHLEIPNFPFHKHEKDGTVVSSTEISITEIFDELYNIIDK